MHAFIAYIACIVNMQYTIRSIPKNIDSALRDRARHESKSLNAFIIETLERGLELDAKPQVYDDIDALIGTWQEDNEFDRAIKDFERIDEESAE